jgi:ion channel
MNAPRLAAERSFGLRRLSALELLVAIVVLLVSFPFLEKLSHGALIESILTTFVLVSAVLAIAGRRVLVIIAIILALPTLAARWIYYYRPDLLPSKVFLIGGIVFTLFVIVNLLRFVLTAQSVDIEVLSIAISAYLLLGLLWTFGYWLSEEMMPGAFAFNSASAKDTSILGFNGIYFSFVTLSTLGYGDITPVSGPARMLAAAESTTGLLYIAVLIARLVSLYSTPTQHEN